jgi:hypothetical protein
VMLKKDKRSGKKKSHQVIFDNNLMTAKYVLEPTFFDSGFLGTFLYAFLNPEL